MIRRVVLWAPVALHMAIIFSASSVPGGQLPGGLPDKLLHFLEYALLGVLFVLPLSGGRLAGVTMRTALAAIVLSSLYGITDELHQALVPGRSPDPMDVVADAIGASAGALAVLAVRLGLERRRHEAR